MNRKEKEWKIVNLVVSGNLGFEFSDYKEMYETAEKIPSEINGLEVVPQKFDAREIPAIVLRFKEDNRRLGTVNIWISGKWNGTGFHNTKDVSKVARALKEMKLQEKLKE